MSATRLLRRVPASSLRSLLLMCCVASLMLSGCTQPRAPLGDGTLSGKLPTKWEHQPVTGKQKVRVARMWVPDPWELHVYSAPDDATPQKKPGWKFIRKDKRQGPAVRVGGKDQSVVHPVRIYQGRVGDLPLLEASADARLGQRQVEKFLASLRSAVK